jgi:gamma-tubulin complex component 5
LHSTGIEFQEEIQSATDLDKVMAAHDRYLTRIHDRCLLHPRAQFIHQIIIKILNMALVFSGSWEQGVNRVR